LPGGQVLEEFEIDQRLDSFQSAFLVITNNHSNGCTAWRATQGCVDRFISLREASAAPSSHKWLSILLLRFR
jgi:hypothetical protein